MHNHIFNASCTDLQSLLQRAVRKNGMLDGSAAERCADRSYFSLSSSRVERRVRRAACGSPADRFEVSGRKIEGRRLLLTLSLSWTRNKQSH